MSDLVTRVQERVSGRVAAILAAVIALAVLFGGAQGACLLRGAAGLQVAGLRCGAPAVA